jgi:hypothetical protein
LNQEITTIAANRRIVAVGSVATKRFARNVSSRRAGFVRIVVDFAGTGSLEKKKACSGDAPSIELFCYRPVCGPHLSFVRVNRSVKRLFLKEERGDAAARRKMLESLDRCIHAHDDGFRRRS